jgi:predicted nucleotidyltransferase
VTAPSADLVARLREAIATGGIPVRLAVLFGSHATGKARDDSDVDLGIVPVDEDVPLGAELAEASRLSSLLGVDVDLVRLDQDDPLLGREVAMHGQCVFEVAPGTFSAYRATAVSRWLDFDETIAPHRQRFLARLSARA